MKNFSVVLLTSDNWPLINKIEDNESIVDFLVGTNPNVLNVIITDSQIFNINNCLIIRIGNCQKYDSFTFCFDTLKKSLKSLDNFKNIGDIFTIGSPKFNDECLMNKHCQYLYLFKSMTSPEIQIPMHYNIKYKQYFGHEDVKKVLMLTVYYRIDNTNSQEYQYLNLLKNILKNGQICQNRTGTPTLAIFDANLQFDIGCLKVGNDYIYDLPMYTTKKVFLKPIVWELLWFLNGFTNNKWLQERNVHIWDDNSSAKYLAKKNLPYEEGEIGPGYGHQWINWGKTDTNPGINQVQKVIDQLKTDPTDRRMIISAWNVADLDKMALPPCHILYNFSAIGGKLNCKVFIRSNDMFLGNPFNVTSAAILTILISRCVNMEPGKIAISITDAHIYENHVEQSREQIKRFPFNFPKLKITKKTSSWEDLCQLTYDDFVLEQYKYWPILKGKMAA